MSHVLYSGLRGRRWRALESAVALALIVTIVAMHAAFAGGAFLWYDAASQVNQNDFFADAAPTPTAPPTSAPTPTIPPTPRPQYSFLWNAAPAPTNPYPSSAPTNPPNGHRITFLLIGVDFMEGRSHSLTDSLMVVSVDTRNAQGLADQRAA